jgi:RNA polymerase sigma-54 factor
MAQQGLFLSQKLALSQVLAPQLQQSLALLQAPTLELSALVQQEMEQNPTLEEMSIDERPSLDKDEKGPREEEIQMDPSEPPQDTRVDPTENDSPNEPVDDFQAEFEKLTQLDQEWKDHFSQTNTPMRSSDDEEEKRQFMMDSITTETSLQEFLIEQLRISDLRDELTQVAEMIIGNIDDYGYLQSNVNELAFSTSIDPAEIEEALRLVQSFDPPGVGCRDLRECLMLQLQRAEKTDTLEYKIIDKHMAALGKRRLPDIARGLGIGLPMVRDAVDRIGHLDPRPGRAYMTAPNHYVMPEVFVVREAVGYSVTTNDDYIPHLRISNHYKDLMSQGSTPQEVKQYIREKVRAGMFLIKSLHQRQQTILNIANEIVKRQTEFLDHGVSKLKPMTMAQVADAVEVHETTVSRAVSGKYIETPQGVYEMKFFFSSGIQTQDGEGMSNTSVKDKISDIFKNEDPHHPLSDQEVVDQLKDEGIKIARRTVAKYRSELNILPSSLRKTY